jgi:hypothetical protein
MEHFETWLFQLSAFIGVGTRVFFQPFQDHPDAGPGVTTAFGVGEDVELDLADSQL